VLHYVLGTKITSMRAHDFNFKLIHVELVKKQQFEWATYSNTIIEPMKEETQHSY